LASQLNNCGNDDGYDEKKRYDNCGGNFAPGGMVVGEGAIVHDSNCTIGLGGVSASRGTARGRSLIGNSKDGARGKGGLEGWGISRDNRELEVDGIGGIPPLWLESSLIGTGGKIDIMPDVDAGVAGAGGVEVYVNVACGETSRVPGDIDRCRVR
jgi:hypothetical protein